MRLINTQTESLEEFVSLRNTSPYAILSHTWGDDEVTFQELSCLHKSALLHRKGYIKIREVCRIARLQELKYVWVDTCCIDKSSSAELTEAINSMFRWYAGSHVCYALLQDFQGSDYSRITDVSTESELENCRWFTRGWTLQEMIAPTRLEFYNGDFDFIGSKTDLGDALQNITGVSEDILSGSTPLSRVAVARRLSWAAKRNTTRLEDSAYCLLGIFNVSMPLVHGEGGRAFQRLQEEIIKESNDLSLFAWCADTPSRYRGLLANSPSEYKHCSEVHVDDDLFFKNPEYSVSNKGIKIQTELIGSIDGTFLLDLKCFKTKSSETTLLICLRQVHKGVFLRESPASFRLFTLANEKSKEFFKSIEMFHGIKSIDDTLFKILEQYHSPPFIFREGFTEYGEQESPEVIDREPDMYTTSSALTYCINHQYNKERTLRPSFPRYGKASCRFNVTTLYGQRYHETSRQSESLELHVWMGMSKEGSPWIHCSFTDESRLSEIAEVKQQGDKGNPQRSEAQRLLLSLNPKHLHEFLSEQHSTQRMGFRMGRNLNALEYNTGKPSNFYVCLELADGSISNSKVIFIDLKSVKRTRREKIIEPVRNK